MSHIAHFRGTSLGHPLGLLRIFLRDAIWGLYSKIFNFLIDDTLVTQVFFKTFFLNINTNKKHI